MRILSKSNGPKNYVEEITKKISDNYIDGDDYDQEEISEFFNSIPKRNKSIELDKFFGEYNRITFDISKVNLKNHIVENSVEYLDIKKELESLGYDLKDYVAGICTKDKRSFKIGKILTKNKSENLKKFNNSILREGLKQKLVATVSRNDYDVITMSTFRGWRSCMNIIDGENSQYICSDIEHNTLVVYLHEESDVEIKNPAARVLLKQHYGDYIEQDKKIIVRRYYPEEKTYGTTSYDLVNIANKICEEINVLYQKIDDNAIIMMHINEELYQDSDTVHLIKNRPWDLSNIDDREMFDWDYTTEEETEKLVKFLNDNSHNPIYFDVNFVFKTKYNYTMEFLEAAHDIVNIHYILRLIEMNTRDRIKKLSNEEFNNILNMFEDSLTYYNKQNIIVLYERTINPTIDNENYLWLKETIKLNNSYDGNIDIDKSAIDHTVVIHDINVGSNFHKFIINNLDLNYNYIDYTILKLLSTKYIDKTLEFANNDILYNIMKNHEDQIIEFDVFRNLLEYFIKNDNKEYIDIIKEIIHKEIYDHTHDSLKIRNHYKSIFGS